MSKVITPAAKGVDAIIYFNETPLAGQKQANLNRTTYMANITNEIEKDWAESLPATKNWTLNCSGMFIKSEAAYSILEQAYVEGTLLDVELRGSAKKYVGKAYLSSFPLSVSYDDSYSYSLTFEGSGELQVV